MNNTFLNILFQIVRIYNFYSPPVTLLYICILIQHNKIENIELMEVTKKTPANFGVTYGVTLGVIFILIAVIMYVTGMPLEGKQWPQYLYYLIYPAGIIIAIKKYKVENGDFLKLSEALKIGLAIGAVSGIVYLLYAILFNYVIDPEYNAMLIDVARDQMLTNPNITEEQLEQTMTFIETMANPILGGALWVGLSLFFGLIYSLIGGLIMKQDNPHQDA